MFAPDAKRASRVEFPLRASEDGRSLVDAAGRPFILRGRTAWYVISQPVEMQEAFLNDCVSKGFNAIEMKGITHDKNGNRLPFAGNEEVPFEKRLNGQVWEGVLSGSTPGIAGPSVRDCGGLRCLSEHESIAMAVERSS